MNRNEFMRQPNIKGLSKKKKQAAWNRYQMRTQTRKSPPAPRNRAKAVKVILPACTRDYLQVLSDPFHVNEPVCIPDNHVVPSKKLSVKTRGSFSTSSNKEGFIVFNPFHTANDPFVHVDGGTGYTSSTVMYSDGTVGLTIIETRQTTGNGVGGANLALSPYTILDFDEKPDGQRAGTTALSVQSRVVGVGLRVRYAGTKLNEGGTILTLRREDGETLHGYGYDVLASRPNTKSSALGSKWHEVAYLPVQPTDYDYCRNGVIGAEGVPGIDTSSNTVINNVRYNTGFYIKSAAASQPFEFEHVIHVEFLGKALDSITKSHSDITGMSHVRNALAQAPPEVQAGPTFFQKMLTSVSKEVLEHAPQLAQAGLKYLV